MSEHLTGYDSWKTNAPDPGSGPQVQDVRREFWNAYEVARRHRMTEEFLDGLRGCSLFANLIEVVESQLRCQCGAWMARVDDGRCYSCRLEECESSGQREFEP